jgi:hypothetical protein
MWGGAMPGAASSAAFGTGVFGAHTLFGKTAPLGAGMWALMDRQVALIRIFVTDFAQQSQYQSAKSADVAHNSSTRSWEITNGDSSTRAACVPRKMPYQTRNESSRMVATINSRRAHNAASRRALKIRV